MSLDCSWVTTDFSAIVKLISTERPLPASHLLARILDQEVLGSVDKRLVKASVRSLEDDEHALECAIEEVRTLLSVLQYELDEVKHNLDNYRVLIAPVRNVPFEIMQDIFLNIHAEERNFVPKQVSEAKINRPPIVAQVNRQWRRVALATPNLWSRCTMVLGTTYITGQLNALSLRMARSNPLPISLIIHTSADNISVRYEDTYSEKDPDAPCLCNSSDDVYFSFHKSRRRDCRMEDLISKLNAAAAELAKSVIVPNLDRLGSITVLQYSSALQHLLKTVRNAVAEPSLPHLKSLSLPDETWSHAPNLPFELAPNLERLSINPPESGGTPPQPVRRDGIPWTTLAAFRGRLADSDLGALFKTSRGRLILAEISVTNVLPRVPATAPIQTSLHSLTSLFLQVQGLPESPDLLPCLPALRHLVFHSGFQSVGSAAPGRAWKAQALVLVNAWGCRLDYLGLEFSTLTVHQIQPDDLDDIVAAAPNIEALALPTHWHPHLDRVVTRLNRLAHVELVSHAKLQSSTVIPAREFRQWPVETLAKLRTLTFLAPSAELDDLEHVVMGTAEGLAEENPSRLGPEISFRKLYPGVRFSTPYFVQKGGVFAQCLSDEGELQYGVGLSDYYCTKTLLMYTSRYRQHA